MEKNRHLLLEVRGCLMAWIYSLELAESAWLLNRGLEQSPIANKTPMHRQSFCLECDYLGNGKLLSTMLQSGMTCEHFALSILISPSTSLLVDSRVRISALQEMETAWKEGEAGYFLKLCDWLASFDRDSFSWKMCQLSLFEGLTEFSWSSLRSGTIVDGRLYQPQNLVPHTSENDGSYLLTPTASDYGTQKKENQKPRPSLSTMARKNLLPTPRANDAEKRGDFDAMNPRNGLPAAVKRLPTPCARDWKDGHSPKPHGRNSPSISITVAEQGYQGYLNPAFVEAMMGFEIGHTDLDALGTQWFQNKQKKLSSV